MTKPAAPWMKFYPQDWRADERLRLCSLAARGLWMEMLAIMHRSERYGQLLISGHVPTDAQLAVQAGASPSEVSALLAELDSAGVFSRTANGAIYSRRMTRDARKAKTARENGKSGGNPKLCNKSENPASDKGSDKPALKGQDKPQMSETRYSVPNGTGGEPPDPVKQIWEIGVNLLTAEGMDAARARSMIGGWRKRFRDDPVLRALMEARRLAVSAPSEWVTAALNRAAPDPTSDLIAQASRYAAA